MAGGSTMESLGQSRFVLGNRFVALGQRPGKLFDVSGCRKLCPVRISSKKSGIPRWRRNQSGR